MEYTLNNLLKSEEDNLCQAKSYERNVERASTKAGYYTRAYKSGGEFPWGHSNYDKELYKKHNEVERLFRRLKGYRHIATSYDNDKLDALLLGFIIFTLIVEALKIGCVSQAVPTR